MTTTAQRPGRIRALLATAFHEPQEMTMTEPRTYADGGASDVYQLYALHDAIKDSGGNLTRPVHKAIDELRAAWDQALRHSQASAAPSVPADADLRDRIAKAIRAWLYDPKATTFGAGADAVLAVHPAPADRAGEAIDWKAKYEAEHARHVAVVGQLVADPAAVLRGAADEIDRETQRLKDVGVLEPDKFRPCRDATADLRRMADEAQQAGEEPAEDGDMPCGEAGCFCRCTGPVGHACACDCPHDDDCDFCTPDDRL